MQLILNQIAQPSRTVIKKATIQRSELIDCGLISPTLHNFINRASPSVQPSTAQTMHKQKVLKF
jgi:hypothetical protein